MRRTVWMPWRGPFLWAAVLLLAVLSGNGLAMDFPAAESSAVVADDQGSLTVSAGAKYLMPQGYNGADAMVSDGSAKVVGSTDTKFSTGFFAPSVSFAGDRKTSLTFPGLRDVHLVGDFNYAGGGDRRSGIQKALAGSYFVALSIDPDVNWLGGLIGLGGTANLRVSMAVDNFDASLGFEGRSEEWRLSGGATVTPSFRAGLFASTQRYRISTRLALVAAPSENDSLVESIRTTDIGPELRAGLAMKIPNGVALSATASAALLAGWADLSASQTLETAPGVWVTGGRSMNPHATHADNDAFVSGLFGLSLRAEAPLAEKLKLGLDASARYWTSRPTIKNPAQLDGGGTITTGSSINPGVRIGYDSAAELGLSLGLTYFF